MAKTFDVIVVGAGYIGCSVSYHLCSAGLKVALIERGSLAAGASRANYGNIQIQDMELEKSVSMNKAAVPKFQNLEEELGYPIGYRKIGGLLLIENEIQWRMMEERLNVVRGAGIQSELVPAEQLKEVEPEIDPTHLLGALYHAHEGQVDPFQFISAYLLRARQMGLNEFCYTEVDGFLVEGDRVLGAKTTQGDFYAGTVILCTGARTRHLVRALGLDLDIHYVLGQAAVTEPIRLCLRNHIASASFFERTADHEKGEIIANFAISQSPHGHLLLGEAMYEADHFRTDVPYSSMPAVSKAFVRHFPSMAGLRVLRGWSAAVAHTSDSCPMLGSLKSIRGLILATAFRSTVVVTPLAGETVAQLVVQGKTDLNIENFSPERTMSYAH